MFIGTVTVPNLTQDYTPQELPPITPMLHTFTNCKCNLDSMAITSAPTPKTGNLLQIKRIIFHDPATIVFWEDGTKTVVKCMEGTPFNPYYGFLCALGKKVYGSNSAINRIIREHTD